MLLFRIVNCGNDDLLMKNKIRMKKISKITLTANNGVFKDLIHEIVHAVVYNRELEKFKIVFLANIVETQIIITGKKRFKIFPEDWTKLLQFFEKKTKNLVFTKVVE